MKPARATVSDEELLRRLKTGDEAAFTAIYDRYWEKLLALGLYYTQHKQHAQDVVQDVMMSLWKRKETLDIQSLPAFLATATKFAVFKTIARQKRRNVLRWMEPADEKFSNIEEQLETKFLQEYLQGVIEKLPEKARLVFIYSRVHQLPVKDIANKTQLSVKTVEYHLTKALKQLRETFKKINFLFV